MKIVPTAIPDVLLITPRVFTDSRGFFLESWNELRFAAEGVRANFVQDNHSQSSQWTLRGLHYQIQRPQGKLVRVCRGTAFDVAVDIRKSSLSFGKWVGVELSETNHCMLWVPPGFAHGFLALSDRVDFLYKCTDFYAPEFERTIRWDDPAIDIRWPLPASVSPLLGGKDREGQGICDAECFP
jgi:dTDP-4-dehydrorhamnose 3,5-epimerase